MEKIKNWDWMKLKYRSLKWFKRYNEFFSLIVAVLLYFLSPEMYRYGDSDAGSFDAGYLHTIIFAIVSLNALSGFSWLLMAMNFPKLYKFLDDEMEGLLLGEKRCLPQNATEQESEEFFLRHEVFEMKEKAVRVSLGIYFAYMFIGGSILIFQL